MSVNLYAGNLSYDMKEDSLKNLFESHGEVKSAKIIIDKYTGRSKGFGFIEMASENDANTAIAQLDGNEIMGRNIRVNFAKPRFPKKDQQPSAQA
ncbi:MAG: RNA-binding protein [Spirochaetae bacterium HGW-Spirochaetae-1]|jgi:RNA recognition motif-containing protein|nr:MAG: RNA-binding protein [Spirochaetae bacterium HGW-Spirochaetae-1]